MDWGRPGRAQDHWTLGTYIGDLLPQMLTKVREHSGSQKLSLHGWSFGGLFSLCYTALSRDPDIVNLALIGAPCDYHANGVLGEQYQRLAAVMQWDPTPHRLAGPSVKTRPLALTGLGQQPAVQTHRTGGQCAQLC